MFIAVAVRRNNIFFAQPIKVSYMINLKIGKYTRSIIVSPVFQHARRNMIIVTRCGRFIKFTRPLYYKFRCQGSKVSKVLFVQPELIFY